MPGAPVLSTKKQHRAVLLGLAMVKGVNLMEVLVKKHLQKSSPKRDL